MDAHKDVDGHDDFSKPLRHRYSSKRPPDTETDTKPRIGEKEFKRRCQVFQPSLEDAPEAEHGDGLDEEFAVASLDLAAEEASQHGAFYPRHLRHFRPGHGFPQQGLHHAQAGYGPRSEEGHGKGDPLHVHSHGPAR